MSDPQPRPVWHDPLIPTNTGASAYVEQPEPRPNPMTIEGEIAGIGLFAQGAVRAQGWRGKLARGVILWMLLGFFVVTVASTLLLFR